MLNEIGGDLGVKPVDEDLRRKHFGSEQVGSEDNAKIFGVHKRDIGELGEVSEKLEQQLERRKIVHGQADYDLLQRGDVARGWLLKSGDEMIVFGEGNDGLWEIGEELFEDDGTRVWFGNMCADVDLLRWRCKLLLERLHFYH